MPNYTMISMASGGERVRQSALSQVYNILKWLNKIIPCKQFVQQNVLRNPVAFGLQSAILLNGKAPGVTSTEGPKIRQEDEKCRNVIL